MWYLPLLVAVLLTGFASATKDEEGVYLTNLLAGEFTVDDIEPVDGDLLKYIEALRIKVMSLPYSKITNGVPVDFFTMEYRESMNTLSDILIDLPPLEIENSNSFVSIANTKTNFVKVLQHLVTFDWGDEGMAHLVKSCGTLAVNVRLDTDGIRLDKFKIFPVLAATTNIKG